ncbi:hypothetical protein PYCC9005_002946 [Savitreella phatthalungensis]
MSSTFKREIPSTLGSSPPGKIKLVFYMPRDWHSRSTPMPCVVNFHGGGFTIGAPEDDSTWATVMVEQLGACCVSVGYRLAPEHPFPTAVDDGADAVLWLVEHAQELNIDRSRLVTSGFSAGGNLAFTVPMRLHEPDMRLRPTSGEVVKEGVEEDVLARVPDRPRGDGAYDLVEPEEVEEDPSLAHYHVQAIVAFYPCVDFRQSRLERAKTNRKGLNAGMPAFFTDLFDASYLFRSGAHRVRPTYPDDDHRRDSETDDDAMTIDRRTLPGADTQKRSDATTTTTTNYDYDLEGQTRDSDALDPLTQGASSSFELGDGLGSDSGPLGRVPSCDMCDPLLSPAAAPDWMLRRSLPRSLHFFTAEWDDLLREAERFQRRLTRLGKDVHYRCAKGRKHAWDRQPNPYTRNRLREHMYARAAEDLHAALYPPAPRLPAVAFSSQDLKHSPQSGNLDAREILVDEHHADAIDVPAGSVARKSDRGRSSRVGQMLKGAVKGRLGSGSTDEEAVVTIDDETETTATVPETDRNHRPSNGRGRVGGDRPAERVIDRLPTTHSQQYTAS